MRALLEDRADDVFSALSDGVRREMLVRLARAGPQPTGALLTGLGMTRQGAARHLQVLTDSGLVRSRRIGRVVVRELDRDALRGSAEWLEKLGREWDERLERLRETYGKD
jgi:DNA-binding transcriptional ArsR family regulator